MNTPEMVNDNTARERMLSRVADVFAPADRERMVKLNRICSDDRCHYCKRKLSDETLARSPGVCSATKCRKQAAAAVLRKLYGSCGPCVHRNYCRALICSLRDDSPCDWVPSRFQPRQERS